MKGLQSDFHLLLKSFLSNKNGENNENIGYYYCVWYKKDFIMSMQL